MKNQRVGILFQMNGKNHVTLVDARSRNRFKKLITEWAPVDGQLITNPTEHQVFNYFEVHDVLDDIERTYKELQNTPAIEKIAERVFKMINTIRLQNNLLSEYKEEDEDDEEDEIV